MGAPTRTALGAVDPSEGAGNPRASGSSRGSDTAGVGTWRYPSAAPFETMYRPFGQSCVASMGTSAWNASPSASGDDSGVQWLSSTQVTISTLWPVRIRLMRTTCAVPGGATGGYETKRPWTAPDTPNRYSSVVD